MAEVKTEMIEEVNKDTSENVQKVSTSSDDSGYKPVNTSQQEQKHVEIKREEIVEEAMEAVEEVVQPAEQPPVDVGVSTDDDDEIEVLFDRKVINKDVKLVNSSQSSVVSVPSVNRQDSGDIQIMSKSSRSSESPETSIPAEKCAICSETFSSMKLFYAHLAMSHFREQLQKKLFDDPSTFLDKGRKCPSCKVFVSSDMDMMINHYGAICLPIPVKVNLL